MISCDKEKEKISTYWAIMMLSIIAIVFISGCVADESTIKAMKDKKDIDGLIKEASDPNGWTAKIAAIKALGEIGKGDQKIIDSLINILQNDKEQTMRKEAADALGRIGDKKAIYPLINALQDDVSSIVRGASAKALGQIGDNRAIDPIVLIFRNDRDRTVQKDAADALDNLSWNDKNDTDYIHYLVITEKSDELLKSGKPIIEPLIYDLKSYDSKFAADTLVKIGNPAIDPLVKLLKEDNDSSSYRSTAIDVLDKIGWRPRKMSTGTRLDTNYNSGNGELTVENGLSWDAVVVLSRLDNQNDIISTIYINSGDSYTISNIPDGTDTLFFKLGKDFDDTTKEFTITTRYVKFEDPLKFEISKNIWGESFSATYKVTLHVVEGGNAQTDEIDKNAFPKI